MNFCIICVFFVVLTIIQVHQIFGQSNERGDLLEWYYKQSKYTNQNSKFPRPKRQIQRRYFRQTDNNYDYNDNNSDEDDDWYVFDRADNTPTNNNARNFQEPWQNNRNQIPQQPSWSNQNNQPSWFNTPPATPQNSFFTTTTPQPVIPNAGPPRLPPCEENCNARTTSEYNPVCGTNQVTYFNNARFECARFCGRNIDMRNRGRCGPLLPRT